MATLTLALGVMAPSAFAQSGGDGYGAKGPSVLGQTQGGGGGGPSGGGNTPSSGQGSPAAAPASGSVKSADSSSGSLPFTGLDIGLVAIAGASLLLVGVGMRRLTRTPDSV